MIGLNLISRSDTCPRRTKVRNQIMQPMPLLNTCINLKAPYCRYVKGSGLGGAPNNTDVSRCSLNAPVVWEEGLRWWYLSDNCYELLHQEIRAPTVTTIKVYASVYRRISDALKPKDLVTAAKLYRQSDTPIKRLVTNLTLSGNNANIALQKVRYEKKTVTITKGYDSALEGDPILVKFLH